MRITLAAIIVMATAGLSLSPAAQAQGRPRDAAASTAQATDLSAQSRRRPRVRIYRERPFDERGVYPSYNPGPNAVRDCTATYVQEFRPSGTVITPRLNCYWRRG